MLDPHKDCDHEDGNCHGYWETFEDDTADYESIWEARQEARYAHLVY